MSLVFGAFTMGLILALLSKSPADRPANAAVVADALEAMLTGAPPAVAELAPVRHRTSLDRLASGVFVGRTREMNQLRERLDAALAGRGRLLLVSGEPGSGKTRLTEELTTYARVRGAGVLEPRNEKIETSIDRFGGDYRNFDVKGGDDECKAACTAGGAVDTSSRNSNPRPARARRFAQAGASMTTPSSRMTGRPAKSAGSRTDAITGSHRSPRALAMLLMVAVLPTPGAPQSKTGTPAWTQSANSLTMPIPHLLTGRNSSSPLMTSSGHPSGSSTYGTSGHPMKRALP